MSVLNKMLAFVRVVVGRMERTMPTHKSLLPLLLVLNQEAQPLYSTKTVALMLHCSEHTIRRYIREGKLTAMRAGRRILGVTNEALVEFLDGGSK